MKFVTGLLTGIALGAVGAVYYAKKSGQDLRTAFDDVRAEFDARDYDALGARIERGFADLQAAIEARRGLVRAGATAALDEAEDAADDLTDDGESLADDATDAVEAAGDAVSDAASDVADAAGEAVDDADAWSRDRA